MNVEPCRFGIWSAAYRCSVGACELIVVADVGPRILSLRQQGGPNLLYEDATGFGVGDWRLYGGHRFTVAPESDQSYTPDNTACVVETCGEELCFAGPINAKGLRRVLSIGPAADAKGFTIGHALENHGRAIWRGALWAITCVPSAGQIIGACSSGHVRFWPDACRHHWRVAAGDVIIKPDGSRSKGGWYSDPAWLAFAQTQATLLIHAASAAPPAACVDGGCNVEVFTCADYVEVETLSGGLALESGERALHRQYWHVLASSPAWRNLAQLVASVSPAISAIHAA